MNQVLEFTKPVSRFKDRPAGHPAKPFKIIGPGLGRTGTTSLSQALNILGFHNNEVVGEWYLTKWRDGRLVFDPDRDIACRFDAYLDSPVPLVYKELVQLFPGSKIILTSRDVESWLPSMKYLLDTVFFGLESQAAQNPQYGQMLKELEAYNLQTMGAARFDEDIYAAKFREHYREVQTFFANRPEPVLELDITQNGDGGWSQLCDFLGVPEPDEPFPWRNKSGMLKKFLLKTIHVVARFFPKILKGE